MSNPKNRQDRLDQTITAIQHRFGTQGLRQGMARPVTVPHLPTGFAGLDHALAIGGIPRGKLTVLRGALTSGKRVLAALLVAQAQRASRQSCAYLDLAGACDAELLARCGVALDRLFVIQPADRREALDMLLTLTERKELACLVLDEWGSIEADREARPLAARALDQVVQSLARSGVTLIVLDGLVAPWQGVVSAFTEKLARTGAARIQARTAPVFGW